MWTALPVWTPGGTNSGAPALAELLGIVGRDDVAVGVEQIALAVALEDGAEVPAMAVIVGELGVLRLRVDLVVDVAEEVEIAPQAARRGAFRIAVEHLVRLGGARIALAAEALLLRRARRRQPVLRPRPHQVGVGLVVPHRVAEVGVQEDVGLVHVAGHALGGRDRAGEGVADRVALFLQSAVGGVGRAAWLVDAASALSRIVGIDRRASARRGRTAPRSGCAAARGRWRRRRGSRRSPNGDSRPAGRWCP